MQNNIRQSYVINKCKYLFIKLKCVEETQHITYTVCRLRIYNYFI